MSLVLNFLNLGSFQLTYSTTLKVFILVVLIKHNFFRMSMYGLIPVISSSSLFHSFIVHGKKEFFGKKSVP